MEGITLINVYKQSIKRFPDDEPIDWYEIEFVDKYEVHRSVWILCDIFGQNVSAIDKSFPLAFIFVDSNQSIKDCKQYETIEVYCRRLKQLSDIVGLVR